MKKVLLILFVLTSSLTSNSQTIATDNKNKPVFVVFTPQKSRFDFSSKDFSLTIQSKPIKSAFKFLSDPTESLSKSLLGIPSTPNSSINVKKTTVGFIQLSILNATNLITFTDLKDFRPGLSLKIGAQRTVDTIRYRGASWGGGVSFFGSFDNIKLYNTDNNLVEKKYPVSYGVEANLLLYPSKSPSAEKRRFLFSANLTLSKGWNDNSLKNYKDINSTIVTPTVVAFEKFDGKYGQLITDINKARLAVSMPWNFGRISPIPYFVVNSTSNATPTYFTGMFLNLLSEKINFEITKIPSSFGIGIDWGYVDGKWTSANAFVRGAIQIGKF